MLPLLSILSVSVPACTSACLPFISANCQQNQVSSSTTASQKHAEVELVCCPAGVKLLEVECADLEHKAHPALDKLTVRVRGPIQSAQCLALHATLLSTSVHSAPVVCAYFKLVPGSYLHLQQVSPLRGESASAKP